MLNELFSRLFGSVVKYVDTFRIDLTEEAKLFIRQKTLLNLSTVYSIIILRHRKPFSFHTNKYRYVFEKSLHIFEQKLYK